METGNNFARRAHPPFIAPQCLQVCAGPMAIQIRFYGGGRDSGGLTINT